MTNAEQRILEMVAEGKVSANEGEELLSAVGHAPPPRWKSLLNPTAYLGTSTALLLSGVLAAASVAVSRWGVRFDGALDLHVTGGTPTLMAALADVVVTVPLVAVLLWGASRLSMKQGRLVDFLSVTGLARLPMILVAAASVPLIDDPAETARAAMQGHVDPMLFVAAAFGITGIAWHLTWLFLGYRTASGARGARAALPFIALVILAEALSKAALAVMP